MDAFLPRETLSQLLDEFPSPESMKIQFSDRAQIEAACTDPGRWGPVTRTVMDHLKSPPALQWLEPVTAIDGLEADASFEGGGLRQMVRTENVSMNATFNTRQHTGQRRRLNLLVHLNEGWQQDWGGHLEVWAQDMSRRVSRVAPLGERRFCSQPTRDRSTDIRSRCAARPEPRGSRWVVLLHACGDEARASHEHELPGPSGPS
jgi:hypothetical protein